MIRPTYVVLIASFIFVIDVQAQVPSQQNLRPKNLNAQYHRAETAWKSGSSLLEAKARVDQVIEALPNDQEALKLRARILLSLDRSEEAFTDAMKAANLYPNDAETYAIVCEAARKSGRREAAIHAMDQVSQLIIDDAHLQIQLSREAMALEQYDRAEAFARTAMVQAPNDPSTHIQMARIFAVQNKTDAAATILRNGIEAKVISRESVEADTLLARVLATVTND
ncbi:MAG: hypothetical protein HKN43_16585 [Rhodothermales bacterium]|nr:hypothetical protein [Rhodothermales bacterium]